MVIFKNFKELQMNDKNLAEELLDACDTGEWQDEEIYYYEDLEGLADYELREGWYASFFGNVSGWFNGAPDPFDFIDLKALGEALSYSWDESCYYLASTGEVLSTSYGW